MVERSLRRPARYKGFRAGQALLRVAFCHLYNDRRVTLLTVHLWVGVAVVLLALAAVWQRTGRRIALYAATLQILIGIVLVAERFNAPWYHYALALAGWAGYMVANAMTRRGAAQRTVLTVTAIASILILAAFAIGQAAVRAGGTA
jgi:hypothetical protein